MGAREKQDKNLKAIELAIYLAFLAFSFGIVSYHFKLTKILEWEDHPDLNKAVDDLIKQMNSNIELNIKKHIGKSFEIATEQARDELSKFSRIINFDESKVIEYNRNLNISDKVWNPAYKNEIRWAIDTAFRDGDDPRKLARDIMVYLNEPDRMYRRVRNNHGELVASKAMREYKPGKGVYRSSYKNALRLAKSEITKAHHVAVWQIRQSIPYITGYKITVEKSHYCDACEKLQGVYPKDFFWYGWHPMCRCESQPTYTSTKQEIDNGSYSMEQPPMPENFMNYIKGIEAEYITNNQSLINKNL